MVIFNSKLVVATDVQITVSPRMFKINVFYKKNALHALCTPFEDLFIAAQRPNVSVSER